MMIGVLVMMLPYIKIVCALPERMLNVFNESSFVNHKN